MTKETLLSQFDILRTEYIQLINEKDVLLNWAKPQLEALYVTRVGVYQIELLQMQLRIQSLKRKVELVRSTIVRGLPLDVTAIELKVATELANVELQIMTQVAIVEGSKHLLSNLESPERSKELRTVFKQLAKKLHPDVNVTLTTEQVHLWHLVKAAYEHGDLEKLKAVQVAYEDELENKEKEIGLLTEEELTPKIETLKEGIKRLNIEMEGIRKEYPFNLEEKINDEDWVRSEVEKLELAIKQLTKFEAELVIDYETLINGYV